MLLFPSVFHGPLAPGSHRTGDPTASLGKPWSISVGRQGVLLDGFSRIKYRLLALSGRRQSQKSQGLSLHLLTDSTQEQTFCVRNTVFTVA